MWNRTIYSEHIRPLEPIATGLVPRGTLSGPLRGILFDIYGTLLVSDSGDIGVAKNRNLKKKPLEELFEKYGISRSPEAVIDAMFGAIADTHRQLRKKGIDVPEVEIDRIWARVFKEFGLDSKFGNEPDGIKTFATEFELIVNPVFPMPNLKPVLAGCKEKGLLMGIISNAQFYTPQIFQWLLDAKLEVMGFCPELTIYSYRYGHAKPSLHMFQTAVKKASNIAVPPDAILYVGNDMLNDIYPAARCGFQTALFAGDKRSLRLRRQDSRCRDLTPDLVITDLIQLLSHV